MEKTVEKSENLNGQNETSPKEKELNELKDQIAKKLSEKDEKRGIEWGSLAITFVLIVMIAAASIQTWELVNILKKIESGAVQASGPSNAAASTPSATDQLPNMVGGC